jgi:hypothetical protein
LIRKEVKRHRDACTTARRVELKRKIVTIVRWQETQYVLIVNISTATKLGDKDIDVALLIREHG